MFKDKNIQLLEGYSDWLQREKSGNAVYGHIDICRHTYILTCVYIFKYTQLYVQEKLHCHRKVRHLLQFKHPAAGGGAQSLGTRSWEEALMSFSTLSKTRRTKVMKIFEQNK